MPGRYCHWSEQPTPPEVEAVRLASPPTQNVDLSIETEINGSATTLNVVVLEVALLQPALAVQPLYKALY